MRIVTATRALTAAVCLLVVATAAVAQAPAVSQESLLSHNTAPNAAPSLLDSETIRTRVDEVNVVFTVTDSSGKFVSQLALNDLDVRDNGQEPERISYFQQQSGLPLLVGVLVDLSDSVTDHFDFEKKAAITFLEKMLRPNVDHAFVVGFASEVRLLQDFTGDVAALSQAVKRMHLGGDTRLYDAIQFAAAKLRSRSGAEMSRRVIVLITDGVDTRSKVIMYDAVQAALRAETAVYALSSNEIFEGNYPRGEAVLDLITGPTGGSVLRAHSKKEIAHAFDKVGSALRSQYVLGYKPAEFKPDGTFRAIHIATRRNKLRVQCRRGYFAPREEEEATWYATGPR